MARTVIVVPCFNEAERLDAAAFVGFADAHPDVGFLFVDDGSTDGTAALLASLAEHRSCSALVLPANVGKAEAVRQGLRAAAGGRPEHVGFWDADLATPLDELPGFVALLDAGPAVEMVYGSRVKLLGRHIERNPLRHAFGRVAATAVSVMLDLPIYDSQCGAKLFRLTPHFESLFGEPFVTRWIFDVEMLARRRALDGPGAPADWIVEQPLRRWHDVPGTTLRPSDFARAPADLARIWLAYRLWR